MLRDEKLKPGEDVKVITTRYQDAVPFYVQYGFAQVGATAAKSVAKDWTDKGGKIVLTSRPVPIKQWIVSSKVPADDVEKVRSVLLGAAQNDPGKQVRPPNLSAELSQGRAKRGAGDLKQSFERSVELEG